MTLRNAEIFRWHGDIKPENILSVKGQWKLADFGFAKFKRQTGIESSREAEITLDGGTVAYGITYNTCTRLRFTDRLIGPPESQNQADGGRATTTRVTQAVDIWSFGTVLITAATWVVLGYAGIRQFELLRQQGLSKLCQQRGTGFYICGSFHDGRKLLPEVKAWSDYLKQCKRVGDTVTEGVLDLVESRMLLEDPSARIRAKDLCLSLSTVLETATRERERRVQDSVTKWSVEPAVLEAIKTQQDINEEHYTWEALTTAEQ